MKATLFAIIFFFFSFCYSQNTKTNVYLFPGQGSDYRIFSKLKFDSVFQIININYSVPARNSSLAEYAHILSTQIDSTKKYILIGVSLGGMICTELTDFLKPQKTIIISSAKCKSELPFRYRFQKYIPLNKIVPKCLIKLGAQILQPIVEQDRNKNKDVFKSMLKNKNAKFMKRTVNMVINWNRKSYSKNIIHIHGTNDHTLPFKNIKAKYIINNGSHMITLTRGDEINELVQSILKKND